MRLNILTSLIYATRRALGKVNPISVAYIFYYKFLRNGLDDVSGEILANNYDGDSKVVATSNGFVKTEPGTIAAFPNHAVTREVTSAVTNQIVTDMSLWGDLENSAISYDDTTKQNTWTFTGSTTQHRAFANSSVVTNENYTLSFEVKKGESQFIQVTGSAGFAQWVVNFDLLNLTSNTKMIGWGQEYVIGLN